MESLRVVVSDITITLIYKFNFYMKLTDFNNEQDIFVDYLFDNVN